MVRTLQSLLFPLLCFRKDCAADMGWVRSIWGQDPIGNGPFMDEYFRNSLERDSPEMKRICAAVKEVGVFVVLGYSERYKNTLYIAQV